MSALNTSRIQMGSDLILFYMRQHGSAEKMDKIKSGFSLWKNVKKPAKYCGYQNGVGKVILNSIMNQYVF